MELSYRRVLSMSWYVYSCSPLPVVISDLPEEVVKAEWADVVEAESSKIDLVSKLESSSMSSSVGALSSTTVPGSSIFADMSFSTFRFIARSFGTMDWMSSQVRDADAVDSSMACDMLALFHLLVFIKSVVAVPFCRGGEW